MSKEPLSSYNEEKILDPEIGYDLIDTVQKLARSGLTQSVHEGTRRILVPASTGRKLEVMSYTTAGGIYYADILKNSYSYDTHDAHVAGYVGFSTENSEAEVEGEVYLLDDGQAIAFMKMKVASQATLLSSGSRQCYDDADRLGFANDWKNFMFDTAALPVQPGSYKNNVNVQIGDWTGEKLLDVLDSYLEK